MRVGLFTDWRERSLCLSLLRLDVRPDRLTTQAVLFMFVALSCLVAWSRTCVGGGDWSPGGAKAQADLAAMGILIRNLTILTGVCMGAWAICRSTSRAMLAHVLEASKPGGPLTAAGARRGGAGSIPMNQTNSGGQRGQDERAEDNRKRDADVREGNGGNREKSSGNERENDAGEAVRELQQVRQDVLRTDCMAAAGELAAGIAHELRNPLTSIKLIIQAAAQKHRERPLSDKQLQVLLDEISRIEKTVQGFLDFARPPTMHRIKHDVRETLRRALNPVRTRAKQLGSSMSEVLPSEPVIVCGDPERLYQMFINLLLNGLEAMPEGGSLSVSLVFLPGQSSCRIEFSDDGSGFSEHEMERLFEPFVTGKEHCYGLGLAVSRRIVEEHGGTIAARNRPEGGATFVVQLPIQPLGPSTDSRGGRPDHMAAPHKIVES